MKPVTRRGPWARETGPLTSADLVVLSLLAERAMHGHELMRQSERQEVADWASVSKAQVYYAMRKMASLGLIEGTKTSADTNREKTVFTPTSTGLRALQEGAGGDGWASSRSTQPFANWLGLSIHLPRDQVTQIMGQRRAFLHAELARLRESLIDMAMRRSQRAYAGVQVAKLAICRLEAELTWLDGEAKELSASAQRESGRLSDATKQMIETM